MRTASSAIVLLAMGHGAIAQQLPSAGSQLQQIPPGLSAPKTIPEIRIERGAATGGADLPGAPAFAVNNLAITGASVFPEADLVAAAEFRPGAALTLGGLRAIAARITRYYNNRGYFLAQAYVPAQNIEAGRVEIAVLEGRYGKVAIDNQTNFSDRAANRILAGVESGDIVATAPLERRLLLLSDVPGVRVASTLGPGTAVGKSDLLVNLLPGRRVTGSIEADNAGNRYTGAFRAGGTVNLNNALGIGDVVSLRLLTSFDGLAYGRASFQALAGNMTIGVAYARINYRLGQEFASLDASGNADIASVYASHPLVRSRDHNLNFLAGADAKWFEDKLGFAPSVGRRRTQVGTIGLSGSLHDAVLGGGSTSYSASVSVGNLDILGAAERAADAASARSAGGYGKVQLGFARLQTVAGPFSLYGSVRGQIAFDNLDISEKMELGGAYGVRAYPEGEGFGDQGYTATIEPRLRLGALAARLLGDLVLFGLIDVGEVDFAKRPWFAGPNHARRSAYGGGISWTAPPGFLVKATYAHKLGSEAATSGPDRAGRFWVQVATTF